MARVELLAPGAATWRRVARRMLELERAEWGRHAFSESEMRWQVTNASAVIGAVWDDERLIGFAVAGSTGARRANLFNVLIDRAYRGRGLVWPLIAEVELELAVRDFRQLDIDARVENGFADAIELRYGDRATVIEADHPSPYGPQRTLRVNLAARRGRRAPKVKRSPRALTPSRRGRGRTS